MLVRCIDNSLCSSLTFGKEYVVIEEGDKYYVVKISKILRLELTLKEKSKKLSLNLNTNKLFTIHTLNIKEILCFKHNISFLICIKISSYL